MTQASKLAQIGSPGVSTGFKNKLINGDMRIDQYNAGASVTQSGTTYGVDRWSAETSVNSKFTVQQNAGSVTPPAGFKNYLGITITSAYSIGATDYFLISQYVEGLNCADLGWGSANAKSVTLSFWVYSSLTGTFGGVLSNSNNNYSYPFTYTISSANTWTQVVITASGPTSGTWLTTTGRGICVRFGLGVGSTYSATASSWSSTSNIFGATGATSVVATNGATWYITGVQLEVGTTATDFEYVDYGRQLAQCQRYYQRLDTSAVSNDNAVQNVFGGRQINYYFPVNMRANPTVVAVNPSVTITNAFGMVQQCRFEAGSGFYTQGYTAAAEL